MPDHSERATSSSAATIGDAPHHDWRKHEPVTAGATPVWVCKRCRAYRTQEPAPYNLGECPEVIRYAD